MVTHPSDPASVAGAWCVFPSGRPQQAGAGAVGFSEPAGQTGRSLPVSTGSAQVGRAGWLCRQGRAALAFTALQHL